MAGSLTYRELTAPELVKRWKVIVNDNVSIGRDSHLIKEFLNRATPVQILAGMYLYKGKHTISIPQFLRQCDDWLEEDEQWAEVELARAVSGATPADYWQYWDLISEETAYAVALVSQAKNSLLEWSSRILA